MEKLMTSELRIRISSLFSLVFLSRLRTSIKNIIHFVLVLQVIWLHAITFEKLGLSAAWQSSSFIDNHTCTADQIIMRRDCHGKTVTSGQQQTHQCSMVPMCKCITRWQQPSTQLKKFKYTPFDTLHRKSKSCSGNRHHIYVG